MRIGKRWLGVVEVLRQHIGSFGLLSGHRFLQFDLTIYSISTSWASLLIARWTISIQLIPLKFTGSAIRQFLQHWSRWRLSSQGGYMEGRWSKNWSPNWWCRPGWCGWCWSRSLTECLCHDSVSWGWSPWSVCWCSPHSEIGTWPTRWYSLWSNLT